MNSNPLHPIDVNDYPKLFDYVLTVSGLEYFQTIKRNYLMGKQMTFDEYNKLRLLYVYYATANRNVSEVSNWQEICINLDEKGIFEKQMFASKEDLKDKLLITKNPEYEPGLYRKYIEFTKSK